MLLCSAAQINSQSFNFDVDFEPKPHDVVYTQTDIDMSGVKEIITLREQNFLGSLIDTLSIKRYDENGNEVYYKYFSENKAKSINKTIWENNKKVLFQRHDLDGNLKRVMEYEYLGESELRKMSISYLRKTAYYRSIVYTYDSDGNLIEKTRYVTTFDREKSFEKKENIDRYEYDALGNVTKHVLIKPDSPSEIIENYYRSNGILDSIHRVQILNSERTTFDIDKFYYKNDSLLVKKVWPAKGWIGEPPNKEDTESNVFKYDSSGDLYFAAALRNKDTLVKAYYTLKDGVIYDVKAHKISEKYSARLNFLFSFGVNTIRYKFYRDDKKRVVKKEIYHNESEKPRTTMHWIYN